jgi:endogenous inhibitor of DNA gyrase (YacG/DUF329 family)
MASQAKCNTCGLRYDWSLLGPAKWKKFKIGQIYCPKCGTRLEQTSSEMTRYPTVRDLPVVKGPDLKSLLGGNTDAGT